jgi:hypothetical protein
MFWSQTLYFQAFYVNVLYSDYFCFRTFLRHILFLSLLNSVFQLSDYILDEV